MNRNVKTLTQKFLRDADFIRKLRDSGSHENIQFEKADHHQPKNFGRWK